MILHTIRLVDFDMDKGTISLSLLTKISEQLVKISESTLRLYIEGSSQLKRGKMPEWLYESIDFRLTGIKKGSTVLTVEAPVLSDTLKSIQYPLFNELGNEDYSKDTALSLAMLAYQKAISDERTTDLLDKSLLGEMMTFKEILAKGDGQIEMDCPSNGRKLILNKKSFDQIRKLEDTTPAPLKIKLSGKLDVLKHTHSMVEIVARQKRVKVKLPEKVNFDELKPLFGKNVTITGIANYNPAYQLVSIMLLDIKGEDEPDSFFRNIPSLIKETTDIKQLIAKQKYTGIQKSAFFGLVDELAIDEPLDELLASLK
jgi:hypothetical protein